MVGRITKQKTKLIENKKLIDAQKSEFLDKNEYCLINYAEDFRVLQRKKMSLGRDWAYIRACQMFCNFDPKGTYNKVQEAYTSWETTNVFEPVNNLLTPEAAREWLEENKKLPKNKECCWENEGNNICRYSRSKTCGIAWAYRDVAIRKSSQSRFSELALTVAFYFSDVFQWTGGYYMPTEKHITKWAPERIEQNFIKTTPRYKKICDYISTKNIIKFNNFNYLYLFGLSTIPMSFPLNFYVIDEMAEVTNLDYASACDGRLNDKDWDETFKLIISTPRIPGRDICEKYESGTMHGWHVRCKGCGSLENITFLTHMSKDAGKLEDYNLRCSKCNAIINKNSDGVWIAKNPDNKLRLSLQYEKTYTAKSNLRAMYLASQSTSLSDIQKFYWHDLGLPYTPEGTEITEAMIKSCPKYNPSTYSKLGIRTAGVDVGNTWFDIRVSDQYLGKKYVIYSGKLKYPEENQVHGSIAWQELDNLLFNVFGCDIVIVDHEPRVKEARRFAAKRHGKVFRCKFANGKVEPVLSGGKNTKDLNKNFLVGIDRTALLNEVQYQISGKRYVYPERFFADDSQIENFIQDPTRYLNHLTALHRATVEHEVKSNGIVIYTEPRLEWVQKGSAEDHQFLAEAYDTLCGLLYLKKPGIVSRTNSEKEEIKHEIEFLQDSLTRAMKELEVND